ncbi:MAG: hypothetical protein KC492_14280 [Myxococcales bacterium]|nr:hypothetical protein [Myxococcales bacterium]
MEAVEVTLNFTFDATPDLTVLVRADGVEMCREHVDGFIRFACPVTPDAHVVTVESADPHTFITLNAWARERSPTGQSQVCGL